MYKPASPAAKPSHVKPSPVAKETPAHAKSGTRAAGAQPHVKPTPVALRTPHVSQKREQAPQTRARDARPAHSVYNSQTPAGALQRKKADAPKSPACCPKPAAAARPQILAKPAAALRQPAAAPRQPAAPNAPAAFKASAVQAKAARPAPNALRRPAHAPLSKVGPAPKACATHARESAAHARAAQGCVQRKSTPASQGSGVVQMIDPGTVAVGAVAVAATAAVAYGVYNAGVGLYNYFFRPYYTVGPEQSVGGQISRNLTVRFGFNNTVTFVVNTSIQKHCAESYVLQRVTAGPSPMNINTNTIALVSQVQFRAIFAQYVNFLGQQLVANGQGFDPSAVGSVFNGAHNVNFHSDSPVGSANIHSYPSGGGGTVVLTNAQFTAVRDALNARRDGDANFPTLNNGSLNLAAVAAAGPVTQLFAHLGISVQGLVDTLAYRAEQVMGVNTMLNRFRNIGRTLLA